MYHNEFKCYCLKEIFSKEENLFNLKQGDIQPQLLILDRKEDPVTPLLMPVYLICIIPLNELIKYQMIVTTFLKIYFYKCIHNLFYYLLFTHNLYLFIF